MKEFVTNWIRSKKPKKQHKYRAKAPLHIKGKFLSTSLSKDLREKNKKRNIRLVTGDKVKILRGDNRGKSGKVESVNVKKSIVYVTGIDVLKRDGSKALVPLKPSNLQITELSMKDKKREARLKR